MKHAYWEDVPAAPVTESSYQGVKIPVEGVFIRWLSSEGLGTPQGPSYGLRHFTVRPGASIPMHDHAYAQTVFISKGVFSCTFIDEDGKEQTQSCTVGESVYNPAWEAHGMTNISADDGQFLCCICTSSCD